MKYNNEITKYKNAAVTKLHTLQKKHKLSLSFQMKELCLACKSLTVTFFCRKQSQNA